MGVVLLVCVVSLIFTSEADMHGLLGKRCPAPFVYQALQALITTPGQSALVLFIIWRSGDPRSRFGLRPFKFFRDLFGGIIVFAVLPAAHLLLWWGLWTFLSPDAYQGAKGVIGVAVFGFIPDVKFCLFRRVLPIALAHALNNFIAIGNLPWL